MPRLIAPIAGLMACTVIAACQPQATDQTNTQPATSPKPAPETPLSAQVDNTALERFLADVYGSGASRTKPWTHAPAQASFRDSETDAQEPEEVTRQLCADESITSGGQPARLIAVCGQPEDYGHPTPGLTDFFVLRMQDGKAVASAQQHLQDYGSMGNPGEVKTMQLGADLWGFVVRSSFTNMGYTVSNWHLVLPKDDGFHDAGFIRSHIDNIGAVEACQDVETGCTAPEAFDIDFALEPDRSNPTAAHWPLVVTESGPACGKPATAVHRVTLNPATMNYQIPNILKRETCKDDWADE